MAVEAAVTGAVIGAVIGAVTGAVLVVGFLPAGSVCQVVAAARVALVTEVDFPEVPVGHPAVFRLEVADLREDFPVGLRGWAVVAATMAIAAAALAR